MTRLERAVPLPARFFHRPVEEVARDLLGRLVISRIGGRLTAGRITETEAYLGGPDPASHAAGYRRTARNAALYAPPGTWYIYRSYGMHWCSDLVAAPEGQGAAVLLRSLEPVEGIPVMRRRRGGVPDSRLCAGPGNLCQALGITGAIDGLPMHASPVLVARGRPVPDDQVRVTPRIGITKAADWPLRFVVAGYGSGRPARTAP